MLKGFKEFILRGNVIDLAVAVVIGVAFGSVVTSFVTDVLNPLIAAIVGKPDFSAFVANVHGSEVKYGLFLNALISFLLIAAAVYFVMVCPDECLESPPGSRSGSARSDYQDLPGLHRNNWNRCQEVQVVR